MRELKKIINKEGILFVTINLGYATPVTISRWIKKNEIPECCKLKVSKFIRSYNENNNREN